MTIIRGTTPTQYFELPCDATQIKSIRICYTQNEQVVLVKTGDHLLVEGSLCHWTLTQEDTFALQADAFVTVQLRGLLNTGVVVGTEEYKVYVVDNKDEEVMV